MMDALQDEIHGLRRDFAQASRIQARRTWIAVTVLTLVGILGATPIGLLALHSAREAARLTEQSVRVEQRAQATTRMIQEIRVLLNVQAERNRLLADELRFLGRQIEWEGQRRARAR